MANPCGEGGTALPGSQPPAHPQPAGLWQWGDEETALMLCKHHSAIAKALVCYLHCLGYTDKPSITVLLWGKFIPPQLESADKSSAAL